MRNALAALVLLCACAPVRQTHETLDGAIVVSSVSQETHVTLTRADTAPLLLVGAMEPELRQLAGARVTLTGAHVERPRAAFDVASYEIVEIDGARPVIGFAGRGGTILVAGADTLSLAGVQQSIPDNAKVWVNGTREGRTLRVSSWGLIRR